jgi:hypothetical protein
VPVAISWQHLLPVAGGASLAQPPLPPPNAPASTLPPIPPTRMPTRTTRDLVPSHITDLPVDIRQDKLPKAAVLSPAAPQPHLKHPNTRAT